MRHDFPRHWRPTGRYSHTVNGASFGPSLVGETLPAYRERVKTAYGSLRGVTFQDDNQGESLSSN